METRIRRGKKVCAVANLLVTFRKNAYIRFLGKDGGANYAFVGMNQRGRVTTYHIKSVVKLAKSGVSMFLP